MRTSVLLLLLFVSGILIAQAPHAFKYQTVVRNENGTLLPDQPVGFRFSIISGSPDGNVVYSELHTDTTNASGLISLEIGHGLVEMGDFSYIAWSSNDFFLRVEFSLDGSTFATMGIQQLLSVPYALVAETAENPDSDWLASNQDLYAGNTGNIGIGLMTPDDKLSIVGNVKISDTLKFKGYVNATQNNPGQFLIGAHDIKLGYQSDNFGNILIGNSLYGKTVFDLDMTGNGNIGIGTDVYHETTTGYSNLCIGMYTGYNLSTGSNNVFLGSSAGEHIATGNINICIGNQSGNGRQGNSNVFIGDRAGYSWSGSGSDNVMLGAFAGYSYNSSNSSSVFLGKYAGYGNQSSETVCLGPYTGRSATGNRNIFIGYEAGQNWTGGNTLIIDNHNDNATPFIKGDMSGDHLEVNASMTVNGEVQQQSVNIESTLNLQELTEFPLNPTEGDMIYLNDTLRFYNGSVWRNIW